MKVLARIILWNIITSCFISLIALLVVCCKSYNNIKNGIRLEFYLKDLKVDMQQISENYFDNAPTQDKKYNKESAECTICFENKNNILLQPCNHSGFCQDCMIEQLKYQRHCPFCRQDIKQIYVIYYDEEK